MVSWVYVSCEGKNYLASGDIWLLVLPLELLL